MRSGVESVPLKDIKLDDRLQMRVFGISQEVVDEYAEVLDELPPARVVSDGKTKWLTEGWHRYYAHQKAGKEAMPCQVQKGDFLDALLEAAAANASHGYRRSPDDKRKAVLALIEEERKGNHGWSNRQIATFCRVDEKLVRRMKKEMDEVENAASRNNDSPGSLFNDENPASEAEPDRVDDEPEAPEGEELTYEQDGNDDEEKQAEEVPCDEEGKPLPPQAIGAFNMLPDLRVFFKLLDQAARKCEEIGKSPLGVHMHWQSAQGHLRSARKTLYQGRPAHVCPYCDGKKKDCRVCRGHGWVTATTYEQAPAELKGAGEGGAA
jgi:hypothetical protein